VTPLACPCCLSGETNVPVAEEEATYRCSICSHQWHTNRLPENYYSGKEQRNMICDNVLDRKLKSRIQSISPHLYNGMRILEIGCAEGYLGAAIKRLADVEYVGIEISGDAKSASARLDAVVNLPASNFSAPAFDLVLAFHVLEHIADLEAEITHWMRLLKDDGTLILEVPNKAGHPWLSQDKNPEHLHCFSSVSLLALLQRFGLEAFQLSCGNYESPVYPDSLRIIARKSASNEARRDALIRRYNQKMGGKFVVFGTGGDFHNYVEPLIKSLPIAALCDSNSTLHGQLIGTQKIMPYDPVALAKLPILIASLRFKSEITERLILRGVPPSDIIGLDDIYGESE
jgi:2-polyprenyl-3-methyl-5-hydroxy-6-metoxy-1,4-benzoquinol methylase